MGEMIVHKDGLFFGFSSVSDMPSTPVLTRVEFEAYFVYREAERAWEALIPRMERAIEQGSSSREGESAYDVVRHNAKRLSLKRILIEDRESLHGMGFDTALVLLRAGVGARAWSGPAAAMVTRTRMRRAWSSARSSSSPTSCWPTTGRWRHERLPRGHPAAPGHRHGLGSP